MAAQWQPPKASDSPAAQQNYLAQLTLASLMQQAFTQMWPNVLPLTPRNLRRLMAGSTALLDQLSEVAISVATEAYLDLRAEAGVTGPISVPRVETPPASAVEQMWAEVTSGMDDLAALAEDEYAKLRDAYDAELRRELADEARRTTVAAVEGDDKALGFARVARPDACYFCLTLAMRRTKGGRPGVYKTRTRAMIRRSDGEKYHTNCNCQVEAIFSTDFEFAPHILEAEKLYDKATENSKSGDSLNDFRNALRRQRAGLVPQSPLPPISLASAQNNADLMSALLDGIDQAMKAA